MKKIAFVCALFFAVSAHAKPQKNKMKDAIGTKMTVIMDIALDNRVEVNPPFFWSPLKNMIVDGQLYDPYEDGFGLNKDYCKITLVDTGEKTLGVKAETVSATVTNTMSDSGKSKSGKKFSWIQLENANSDTNPGPQLQSIVCERFESSDPFTFEEIREITAGVIQFEEQN